MSPPALEELLHGASAQKAALEVALNSAVTAGRDIAQRLEATMKNATAMQEQEGLKEFIWGTPAKSTVKDVKVLPFALWLLDWITISDTYQFGVGVSDAESQRHGVSQ